MAEIMVCEDDEAVLRMEATILSTAGHKVISCPSAMEALKKLGLRPDSPDARLPDLLVLDIMMPKCDGYTVGAIIRQNPRTQNLPILVVSALREMNKLFTDTAQMDGFLSKPFKPTDLIESVAAILEKRGAQA